VSYLLYFASPGILIMGICETLAIPSSLSVQYFGVKLHSASFEAIVNSAFYTLLLFIMSVVFQRIKESART